MTRLKILASIVFLLALTSCGGDEGISGEVSLEVLPEVPLVVNADFTIGSGDDAEVITGPWFENHFTFENKSDQNLVVVTLKYTVTGFKDGAETVTDFTLDPGDDCEDGSARPFLAYVRPGEKFSGLTADGFGSFCFIESETPLGKAATNVAVPPNFERWYIDGLAATDNSIYSVKIEALGYFEKDDGEITERLTLFKFFSTR